MSKTFKRITFRLDSNQNRLLHRAAGRLELSTSQTLRVAVVMIEQASRAHKAEILKVVKHQHATWDDGRFRTRRTSP